MLVVNVAGRFPSLSLRTALIATLLVPAAAVLAEDLQDQLSTFFVGRLSFGENHGTDCGDIGDDLVQLVSRASTIQVREQRMLALSDDGLFETPFLFMNGHNDFELSDAELENLRTYFLHGGFVFASGCCDNPEFPATVFPWPAPIHRAQVIGRVVWAGKRF